jgi:AraC family transcriptional regulator of arabinose operon
LHINNIGYNHTHDADFYIDRPKGSGDYLLLLLKTPAIFTLDGKDINTDPNSFILFREGTPQLYRAVGVQFSNDWFHFSFDDEDMKFILALDIPFDKVMPVGDLNDLSLIVKNMSYEKYSSNMYKTDSVELYMKLFFIKLSEKIHSSKKDSASSYYDKMSIIRSKIYNMPYNDWNVEGLAHSLTMSKSYFQHLYKEIFGISVMNDVIQSRIEHSKYLLSTTDITITQIAEMCGYKCELHFMRQFKTRMNMTPSEYRRQISNDKP